MKNQKKTKLPLLTRELILSILPNDPIVIEAGAHRGRDTLKMSEFWPQSMIHAFEPVPYLFKILKERTAHKQNIQLYPYALAGKTETMSMYVSDACCDAVSSLLKPKELATARPDITFTVETVSAITLDDWAKKYGVNKVDFMWLDMQGGELAALQASPTILKTITAIKTEISFSERYENSPPYEVLSSWLEQQGFKEIAQNIHHGLWGDALFVRK